MRLLLLFLFFPLVAFSQLKQTVRGRVTDKISSKPIPDVNVYLMDLKTSPETITDKNGYFMLKGIEIGRQNFMFSHIGFDTMAVSNVLVTTGKELILEIQMNVKITEIDQVTVKGFKTGEVLNKMAIVSARTFSVEETERYAGSWNDPARMATNFAGVLSTTNDMRNDIIIRGNSPNGLLWRLEGIDIPNPNHFGIQGTSGGVVSMLNNNQLTRSDFFTGAFPAQYGNALSGVFDLNMRNGNSWKHEFLLEAGVNGFEAGAEGPFSKKYKGSYIINVRYSFLDLMEKVLSKTSLRFLSTALPEYSDLSFKVYLPTPIGTFSLFGLGGRNMMRTADDGFYNQSFTKYKTRLEYETKTGVAGLVHKINIKNNTQLQTSVALSGGNPVINLFSGDPTDLNKLLYKSDIREPELTISSSVVTKINNKNSLSAGVSVKEKKLTQHDSMYIYDYKIYFQLTNVDQKRIELKQAYIEWGHQFTNHFNFYLGYHTQFLNFNSSKSFEPRFGIRKSFGKQHLGFGYGIHSQMQNLQFYFNETSNKKGNYWRTSEDMDFTKSQHFVLSYNNRIAEKWNLKVEAYHQNLWDVPVETMSSGFSTINLGASFYNGTYNRDSLVNNGTGKNYGVDFTLERFFDKKWYMLVTSSLFDSKYRASDGIWRNTAFAVNYSANALFGSEFRVTRHSAINFNFRMVWSGGVRLQYIDKTKSVTKGFIVYDSKKDFSEKSKDYLKFDVKLTFRNNSKRSTQEFGFDISNVTNRKNIYSESFNPKTGVTYYTYQLGLLPTGMFRITF